MGKGKYRITYTNEVPNDQGGVIPNDCIDYSRYLLNPVILREHQWGDYPVGMMTDINKADKGGHSGIPDFNSVTEDSKICESLYNSGHLRSSSIGGESVWKKDNLGNFIQDDKGNRICEKFILYEISLPTLPSNPTAVSQLESIKDLDAEVKQAYTTLKAKIYNEQEIPEINQLCSKYSKSMSEKKSKEQLEHDVLAAKKKVDEATSELEATEQAAEATEVKVNNLHVEEDKSSHIILSAMKIMADAFKSFFATDKKVPIQNEEGGTDPIITSIPGKELVDDKIGDQNQLAAKKYEEATKKYESSLEKAQMCKQAAEEEENEEEKPKKLAAYEKAMEEADKAKQECESAKDAIEKDGGEKEKKGSAKKNEKNTFAAAEYKNKPQRKTMEELNAEHVQLAAEPKLKDSIKFTGKMNVPTFTQLSSVNTSEGKEGRELINRVMSKDASKDLRDYATVLNSILQDPKYDAITETARFHLCNSDAQVIHMRDNPGQNRPGHTLQEMASRLNSGYAEGVNFKAGSRSERITKLTSDGVFSSLDTVAVEWLPLVIFRLVPSNSWKGNIPMIAANETVRNLGVIWTNVASRPLIYRGTVGNATYAYTADTAVGVKLVPYWMETMIWEPLTMHQLRYDQMSSQWAQALADFEAEMSDDQLYTILKGLNDNQPANIVLTGGPMITSQGGNTPINFQIPLVASPDAFILNPTFVTSANQYLTRPGLNDIISGQQIFSKQNYDLSNRKISLVVDPTMYKYLMQDPESKSGLTRWISDNGSDITRFSHTDIYERSRVALYDPAGGTVVDTHLSGVSIPATAISAGVGMVTNDVAIAVGMLDVFAVQDPNYYGYKLSAAMRVGIRALRSDYTGVYGYTFAQTGS